jgi:hypothetical protein
MSTLESFQQLAMRFTDPVQHDYEVIRGIMLEDETIAERSRITGVDRHTISDKAQRFLDTPHLFQTPYRSLQLEFRELDDEQWHKIARRPYERRPVPASISVEQLALTTVCGY